jgi:DNA-binding GntR family transcriptional regulator
MGLVATTPYKGTVVATVSDEQARDIYEVRMLLEGLAGRLFALRGSEEDVAKLRSATDGVARAQRAGDHQELLQAKEQFYAILLAGSRNHEIEHILGGLLARITVLRSATLSVRGRPAKSLKELKRIMAAIEAHDADAAEQACRDHVRNAAAAVGIGDIDPRDGRPS